MINDARKKLDYQFCIISKMVKSLNHQFLEWRLAEGQEVLDGLRQCELVDLSVGYALRGEGLADEPAAEVSQGDRFSLKQSSISNTLITGLSRINYSQSSPPRYFIEISQWPQTADTVT
jgi:hypothetical protein